MMINEPTAFPTAAHAAALPVAGLSATFLPAAG
jgi:hypothetical protein